MSDNDWYDARDSRSLRCAGRVLDPSRWILLRLDRDYASRFEGQVAILVAANLMARMSPSVAIDVPDVAVVEGLPAAGSGLRDAVLALMKSADPTGRFVARASSDGDYVIQLGARGAEVVVHGVGWDSYVGAAPSPLKRTDVRNPIGPAMATIVAIASAFASNLADPPASIAFNSFNWAHQSAPKDAPDHQPETSLGNVWTVGTGSVGTAALYFLTLATNNFSACLFDMKAVAVHNLDRSPLFMAAHVGSKKVDITARYLRGAGVSKVDVDPSALDESTIWATRQSGTPDVLISAANERNVRSIIESAYPPIQIYGTTGKNWQASLIRHIPIQEACSRCLFQDEVYSPTECATLKVAADASNQNIDAALPFMSFAAGAMAAAEILKLGLPGYPFSVNRISLYTQPKPRLVPAGISHREGCICMRRSRSVHQQMIAGSRHARLSK